MAKQTTFGQLFIVATPIGHLSDITLRAIETLRFVDEILCEDTRHSKGLLSHLNISKKLISLHNYNEANRVESILEKLSSGLNLALISDAGTPLISDPGYLLVEAARKANCQVTPIPGPSALITALCASGLPTTTFSFRGFLPATRSKRKEQLSSLVDKEETLIFYESPHRLLQSLEDMHEVFGAKRQLVLCKELTKAYERFISGTCTDIISFLTEDERRQKGEFVILVRGQEQAKQDDTAIHQTLNILLKEGLATKQAANITAKLTGCRKNEAYQLALQLSKANQDSGAK